MTTPITQLSILLIPVLMAPVHWVWLPSYIFIPLLTTGNCSLYHYAFCIALPLIFHSPTHSPIFLSLIIIFSHYTYTCTLCSIDCMCLDFHSSPLTSHTSHSLISHGGGRSKDLALVAPPTLLLLLYISYVIK